MNDVVSQIEEQGFAIVEEVLSEANISALIGTLSPIQEQAGQVSGGVRNLMQQSPMVKQLAESATLRNLVEPVLGSACFPVRAILFDKTPTTNWKIPWHQDVTIAVSERRDCPGYGPWSVKAGVQHVQPPAAVSEAMLSVRLHLDDCPASNGALRVLPGTHRLGKLRHAETDQAVSSRAPFSCEVMRGGVLLMRPLLIHASSESGGSHFQHRRVIHLDYAACDLPCGLLWSETSKAVARG